MMADENLETGGNRCLVFGHGHARVAAGQHVQDARLEFGGRCHETAIDILLDVFGFSEKETRAVERTDL